MEANSTDKKTFQLVENGQRIGELIYESLFSFSAKLKLADSDVFDIKPVGIFGTTITVTKNGIEIADLKMNWRGQIVFTFKDGNAFILRTTGTFYNKYIIENETKEKLIQFDPTFDWSKWNYNYNITYDKRPQDTLLVLLGVYATNYIIAAMSGMA